MECQDAAMTKSPAADSAGSSGASGSGDGLRVEQKWGFGMAPVKPATATARHAAATRVLAYVSAGTAAPLGRLDQLAADLPEVKGLFSRAWRQDQWDWFTVFEALGRPSRGRAKRTASLLGDLRRRLLDGNDEAASEALQELRAAGGLQHLRTYVQGAAPVAADVGFVYVLSTREAPNLLKIGYTERSVRERVNELNSATAVVVPYGARAVWVVRRARQVEGQVHELLAQFRVRRDREFFDMPFRDAARLIDDLVRRSRVEAA